MSSSSPASTGRRKGPRVAQIIEDAQLRPENVLFIDDLALNRAEVRHFSPGIQTAGPEIIGRLLALPELSGKDDPDHTRLEQYRLLERKLADRRMGEDSERGLPPLVRHPGRCPP